MPRRTRLTQLDRGLHQWRNGGIVFPGSWRSTQGRRHAPRIWRASFSAFSGTAFFLLEVLSISAAGESPLLEMRVTSAPCAQVPSSPHRQVLIEKRQDIHHRRHAGRPGDRGGPHLHRPRQPPQGLTLLVVEDGMPGFTRGRELEKMGCKVQDTAELSFVDVRVPAANVLGEEGEAFGYLGPQPAAGAAHRGRRIGGAGALGDRRGHRLHQGPQGLRHAGGVVPEHQIRTGRLLDRGRGPARRCWTGPSRCTLRVSSSGADAARVKLFCTEMQQRVIDRCLQLFGGYGYMMEYPIARLYTDARVARIYAGTSEVMKVIIAKSLGPQRPFRDFGAQTHSLSLVSAPKSRLHPVSGR